MTGGDRRRPRTLEEQNEAFLAARAAADPAAELARQEAIAGSWPTAAEREAVHRKVLRAFVAAAKPLAAAGWDVRSSRALWRSPQGDWARIIVYRTGWSGGAISRIQLDLYSARLLAVVDGRDPSVEPTLPRVPQHLCPSSTEFAFTTGAGPADPAPLQVPRTDPGGDWPCAVLDPATICPWLGDGVGRMADAAAGWLASDVAFRDALVEVSSSSATLAIRRAAILSWLIGDHDVLPDLLALAAKRDAEWHAWSARDRADPDAPFDPREFDRTRDMMMWSHQRFLRYMERDLPKRAAVARGSRERHGGHAD